jgi:hypothetical protein
MQAEKDPQLWEIAKRRASFKYHLGSYIVFNAFFWILWAFTGQGHNEHHGLPWPVWPAFGWGIGLVFHFLGAYVFSKEDGAEKEYEKLTRNKQQ